jgi:DNA polymerase III epsilon subunit-like protein
LAQPQTREAYIVVDGKASGSSPGQYALLSIGACTLGESRQTFYVELQPDREVCRPEAMAVSGLSLEKLRTEGTPPVEASRAAAINIVNDFFYVKLIAVPAIQAYMEQVQAR